MSQIIQSQRIARIVLMMKVIKKTVILKQVRQRINLQKTVIQRIVTKMAIRIVTKMKIQMNKKIIWFSKKFRKIVYS